MHTTLFHITQVFQEAHLCTSSVEIQYGRWRPMCRSTGSLVPVGLLEWHGSCAGPSCCTTPSRSLARLTRVPSTSVFALLSYSVWVRACAWQNEPACVHGCGERWGSGLFTFPLCQLLPALMRRSCLLTPTGIRTFFWCSWTSTIK